MTIYANEQEAGGHFGVYGGRFVPEILMPAVEELEREFRAAILDDDFRATYEQLLHTYVGRPTALTWADRLSQIVGARIYLKREDLCHTGAHKINNAVGQVLLAQRMGKRRIIAETGAGQHGVATATVCAKFGMECVVYMGAEDVVRQRLNVQRMELLGAVVRPVESGSRTLKDATNEAIRDWVTNVDSTHYIIGSVVGPHPYPAMVREFHRAIGVETRNQLEEATGSPLPDAVVACVGGGSNAIGIFSAYLGDESVDLHGVEAAGEGLKAKHAATLTLGSPGVLHGALSYLLQDDAGQVVEAHSISAGLDYPGVGPQHAHLKDSGRVTYHSVTDNDALEGVKLLSRSEGIIPALETAHAVAMLPTLGSNYPDGVIVLNCSGRGDKDMNTISSRLFSTE